MATDYDAPRLPAPDKELPEPGVTQLTAPAGLQPTLELGDEPDDDEFFELPGADLSGEELSVRVVPPQPDEFVCSRCFLVHHRHLLHTPPATPPVCRACAV